jgi:2-polyprenyl-3-methyl-5-hydroxy-6-metoxy-1,4-benzoquinol methylase
VSVLSQHFPFRSTRCWEMSAVTKLDDNVGHQAAHYDKAYGNTKPVVIENIDTFVDSITQCHDSWRGIFLGGLREKIPGRKVLEIGGGFGQFSTVAGMLGADEVAMTEISREGVERARENFARNGLEQCRAVLAPDGRIDVEEDYFDIVVLRALIHHIPTEEEDEFFRKLACCLKPGGEVHAVEPATNWRLLDKLRWIVPMPGRPSSLQKEQFAQWVAKDPHPQRDNSARHLKRLGLRFFDKVSVVPVSVFSRLDRFANSHATRKRIRSLSYRVEGYFPNALLLPLARAHTIVLSDPKKASSRGCFRLTTQTLAIQGG